MKTISREDQSHTEDETSQRRAAVRRRAWIGGIGAVVAPFVFAGASLHLLYASESREYALWALVAADLIGAAFLLVLPASLGVRLGAALLYLALMCPVLFVFGFFYICSNFAPCIKLF